MNQETIPRDGYDTDLGLFTKLEGLDRALATSVCDPVAVPSTHGPEFQPFYDCEDDGIDVMKRRLENHSNDVLKFIALHENLYDALKSVESFSEKKDRDSAANSVEEVCNYLESYASFVGEHRLIVIEPFLDWPTTSSPFGEHYGRRGAPLSFNPMRNREGMLEEVHLLNSLTSDFRKVEGPLQYSKIDTTVHDSGEGFHDASYRGRFALTKELLRRAKEELN